jgi:hypothetical protein
MSNWDDDWDEDWGRADTPVPASGLEQTRDDTDLGWGERTWAETGSGSGDPDDVERFLRERPPHHLG